MPRYLSVLLIFMYAGLNAQDMDSLWNASRDGTVIVIDPVTISSTRYEDRPSFNLLPAGSLDINNGYEVQNVLNQVPGLFMHSGTLSTNRITIRGIGNRSAFGTSKIRAYLEEIPLTSGIGETSLEDVDLSLIEEIEVWKGPTASRYGAGLGGMIQYRLKKPNSSDLEINGMTGSAGLFRTTETLTIAGPNSGISLSHNHTGTNGWRENSEYRREGLSLTGQHSTMNSSWLFLFNGIDLYGQIPSSIDLDDFKDDPSQAAFTWKQVEGYEDYRKFQAGVSNTRKIAPGWLSRGSIYLKGREAYESRPFNILDEGELAYGGRFLIERNEGRWWLRAGTEMYLERLDWTTFETDMGVQGVILNEQRENRNYTNLFAEGNMELNGKWSLEVGINMNKTRYKLEDRYDGDGQDISGDYSYNWVLSPNINLRYRPAVEAVYYLNFGHGLSSPTVEETFNPEGLVNPDIVQEKGWNAEMGTRGMFNDGWTYDITAYHMVVSDLLVSRFQEDINTGFDQIILVNAGRTRHIGLDLYTEIRLLDITKTRFDLGISYSLQDFRFLEFTEGANDHSGNSLTGTIPHRIFGNLKGKIGKLGLIITYQFQDAMPLRDDNTYYSDPYHLVNTRMEFPLIDKDKASLDLYGGVNNLFDTRYASMLLVNAGSFGNNLPRYYYPGQPMNFYTGARFKLRF